MGLEIPNNILRIISKDKNKKNLLDVNKNKLLEFSALVKRGNINKIRKSKVLNSLKSIKGKRISYSQANANSLAFRNKGRYKRNTDFDKSGFDVYKYIFIKTKKNDLLSKLADVDENLRWLIESGNFFLRCNLKLNNKYGTVYVDEFEYSLDLFGDKSYIQADENYAKERYNDKYHSLIKYKDKETKEWKYKMKLFHGFQKSYTFSVDPDDEISK